MRAVGIEGAGGDLLLEEGADFRPQRLRFGQATPLIRTLAADLTLVGNDARFLNASGQNAVEKVDLITFGGKLKLREGRTLSVLNDLVVEDLLDRGVAFDIYYGGRSAVDLARRELFESLAIESGGGLVATTEDGSAGVRGLVTEPLAAALGEGRYDFLYACGPMPLLAALARLSEKSGVPGEAALETPMGCGFGACLGCAVPHVSGRFALCCKDGPVFRFDEVRW